MKFENGQTLAIYDEDILKNYLHPKKRNTIKFALNNNAVGKHKKAKTTQKPV